MQPKHAVPETVHNTLPHKSIESYVQNVSTVTMVSCDNNYDLLNYAELTASDVNCTPLTLK